MKVHLCEKMTPQGNMIISYDYYEIRGCVVVKLLTLKINQVTTFMYVEAAIQRCSYKKVFWKYAANLQENTHDEVWFQ